MTSLLLCLQPKKARGKKTKGKYNAGILSLTDPVKSYIPPPRTEVLYDRCHNSLSPTTSTSADSSDYNRSQQSNDSAHSFQSKSSGYQSGYMTDDSSVEGKLLRKASSSNPANVIMSVEKDYNATCGEEMTVKRGQRLKVLYRQGDWAFAVSKHGPKGYVPYSYLRLSRKYGSASGYCSEPERRARNYSGYETDPGIRNRTRVVPDRMAGYSRSISKRDIRSTTVVTDYDDVASGYMSECVGSGGYYQHRGCRPRVVSSSVMAQFKRNYIEELVVLHDFPASDENEVIVTKGERVKVLNADDPEWLWVRTIPGDEGYVPRSCLSFGTHPALQRMTGTPLYKAPIRKPERSPHQLPHHLRSKSASSVRAQRQFAKEQFRQLALAQRNPVKKPVCQDKEEIRRIGTRLLVLSNYEPTQADELEVEIGDTVLADVLTQSTVKRVWAYCQRTDKLGYLPVWVIHPPVI